MSKNNTEPEIWNQLKKSKNIICCVDSRFDFDAFCSALAFREVIKQELGKEVELTYVEEPEKRAEVTLEKILGLPLEIKYNIDPSDINFSKYDCMVFLDSGDYKHISQKESFEISDNLVTINIDHHSTNNLYGKLNYFEVLPSACSVLYKLFTSLKIKISPTVAKLLLLGIISDSGFLQYEAAKSNDFRDVAELIDLSEKYFHEIVMYLNPSQSIELLKFKKIVYNNLVLNREYKFAYSYALLEDFKKENLSPKAKKERSGSEMIQDIADMKFSVFITQNEDNNDTYNLSFRSSNHTKVDVSKIAGEFNGGGHEMAAGGKSQNVKNLQDLIRDIELTAKRLY